MLWRSTLKGLQKIVMVLCVAGLVAACQTTGSGRVDPLASGSTTPAAGMPQKVTVPANPASSGTWQEVGQQVDQTPPPNTSGQSDLYAFFSSMMGQAQRDKSKAAKDVKVKVGILLPLSGPHKDVGNALLHSAQLAVLDFAGDNFTLLSFDTGGTADGAMQAFQQARNQGVQMVLGPLFASSVETVGRAARGADIPVIGFTNDSSAASSGAYVMGFMPEPQVARLVSYATSKNLSRFAVLSPDTQYGRTVATTLERTLRARGGELVRVEFYPSNTRDFSSFAENVANYKTRQASLGEDRARIDARQKRGEISKSEAKRLKAQLETEDSYLEMDYDAILIADSGQRLRALAPLLPYYDVSPDHVRLMGLSQWEDTAFATTEPALMGSWFVAPEPTLRQKFEETFNKTWGYTPPRMASIAYDATALAAILARIDRGYPDFRRQTITSPNGYEGIDGIFRFRPDGIVERGLAILEIENRNVRIRDKAPRQF